VSVLDNTLKAEFQDTDYRYGYAESFLNTRLATQIKTLREQRGKTQAEVGALMGITQPGFRRFEDVNHSVWKTDTLWKIARALDVRLDISFKTFGSLLEDKKGFYKEALELPRFDQDPAFNGQLEGPAKLVAAKALTGALRAAASAKVGNLQPEIMPPGTAQEMGWRISGNNSVPMAPASYQSNVLREDAAA
jgi:transcriptional regulator with XRE-family HTH domain